MQRHQELFLVHEKDTSPFVDVADALSRQTNSANEDRRASKGARVQFMESIQSQNIAGSGSNLLHCNITEGVSILARNRSSQNLMRYICAACSILARNEMVPLMVASMLVLQVMSF